MDFELVISKFIKQYLDIEHVLGIIFYGSSCYKTNNSESDIDLLIITDNDKNYKGVKYIDNIKIEYFEKNIYYLIDKIERLESSSDRSLVSIFKNGKTIYSKNSTIEFLSEEILSKENSFPRKEHKNNNRNNNISFLYNQIMSIEESNPLFNYYYYVLLEEIRKKYHEENRYSKLPKLKVLLLYSNSEYAKDKYCVKLPDKDFIKRYLDLLVNGYDEDKLNDLISLVEYEDRRNNNSISHCSKSELLYSSTIVDNMIKTSIYKIKCKSPDMDSCFYLTLDKIRNLYCSINSISNSLNFLDENYDITFLKLFNKCLTSEDKVLSITELFNYVVKPLKIDYNNYRVYELS